MVLSMLFIGAGMVSTLAQKHETLVASHRPLGFAIFILSLIRLGWRLSHPAPALPTDLPAWQKLAARGSHWMLYALMLAMPVIGWGILSAGGYPVTMASGLDLPPLLPASPALFAWLRESHRYLAWLFFRHLPRAHGRGALAWRHPP